MIDLHLQYRFIIEIRIFHIYVSSLLDNALINGIVTTECSCDQIYFYQ